jgi:hypothetical protein
VNTMLRSVVRIVKEAVYVNMINDALVVNCESTEYIKELRRYRRWAFTKNPNKTHTLDDLCITSKEWLKYLHKTFEDSTEDLKWKKMRFT